MVSGVVAAFEADFARHRSERRRQALLFGTCFAIAVAVAAGVAEVSPVKLAEGLPALFDYIVSTLPTLRPASLPADIAEWYWGIGKWLRLLFDTAVIAFLGTALGGMAAFVGSFVAARNLAPGRWSSWAVRRAFEFARTVPELVFALIFVYAFGLGPLAGVLAIALHSAGALGKLFAEVAENADPRPIEGLRAAGADWPRMVRYAVVPQVLPNFASYALLRFEINVRAASIVGFVGAGGIGQELYFVIRQFIYVDISAIVLLIIATVMLIDMSCEALRRRLIEGAGR